MADNKNLFNIPNDKIKKIIIIVGIIGIALILFSSFFENDNKKEASIEKNNDTFSIDEYRIELESRLADIISHIDGAGNTGVMITLESGIEYIYAENETSNEEISKTTDGESNEKIDKNYELKMQKSGSNNENPILIKQKQPRVMGVIVVCSGGNNEKVKEAIVSAVTSIFNITSSRVSVNKINK